MKQKRKQGEIVVWLITHPKKTDEPNPGLSHRGLILVGQLARYMPRNYKAMSVICGLGRRHTETLKQLGLSAENENVKFSALAGVASSLKKGVVTLADGTQVNQARYVRVTKEFGSWIYELAKKEGNQVVITSRKNIAPFNNGKPGKIGAIYKLTILPDDEVNYSYLNRSWKLETIFVADTSKGG